jgi:hypothetical protein
MKTRLMLAGVLAASFVSGLFGGQTASAQATPGGYWYGIATVTNDTHTTINFMYRQGGGQWQEESLKPGENLAIYHEFAYQNQNSSPICEIRFDSDMTDGVSYRQYTLQRYNAPALHASFGRQYKFRFRSGDQLDLYKG